MVWFLETCIVLKSIMFSRLGFFKILYNFYSFNLKHFGKTNADVIMIVMII